AVGPVQSSGASDPTTPTMSRQSGRNSGRVSMTGSGMMRWRRRLPLRRGPQHVDEGGGERLGLFVRHEMSRALDDPLFEQPGKDRAIGGGDGRVRMPERIIG